MRKKTIMGITNTCIQDGIIRSFLIVFALLILLSCTDNDESDQVVPSELVGKWIFEEFINDGQSSSFADYNNLFIELNGRGMLKYHVVNTFTSKVKAENGIITFSDIDDMTKIGIIDENIRQIEDRFLEVSRYQVIDGKLYLIVAPNVFYILDKESPV